MIELKTAIAICAIHIIYYSYFQIIAEIMRVGTVHNTPNIAIDRLRTEYKVNIKTFQRNSRLYGTAWFKSIYLNEKLFRKDPKALKFTFHHEYYHFIHKHKQKVLLMRLSFSLTPLLLMLPHVIYFIVVYVGSAFLINYYHDEKKGKFEKKANEYANEMIKSCKSKVQ